MSRLSTSAVLRLLTAVAAVVPLLAATPPGARHAAEA